MLINIRSTGYPIIATSRLPRRRGYSVVVSGPCGRPFKQAPVRLNSSLLADPICRIRSHTSTPSFVFLGPELCTSIQTSRKTLRGLEGQIPACAHLLKSSPRGGVGNQHRRADVQGLGNRMTVVLTSRRKKEQVVRSQHTGHVDRLHFASILDLHMIRKTAQQALAFAPVASVGDGAVDAELEGNSHVLQDSERIVEILLGRNARQKDDAQLISGRPAWKSCRLVRRWSRKVRCDQQRLGEPVKRSPHIFRLDVARRLPHQVPIQSQPQRHY